MVTKAAPGAALRIRMCYKTKLLTLPVELVEGNDAVAPLDDLDLQLLGAGGFSFPHTPQMKTGNP